MTEESQQASQVAAAPTGVWSDITEGLKRKDQGMILALVSSLVAVGQFFGGVGVGTFLAAIMLLNLSLIGWLANIAWQRKKAGEGNGMLLLVVIAFVLAALATLSLCEDITRVNTGVEALNNISNVMSQ